MRARERTEERESKSKEERKGNNRTTYSVKGEKSKGE